MATPVIHRKLQCLLGNDAKQLNRQAFVNCKDASLAVDLLNAIKDASVLFRLSVRNSLKHNNRSLKLQNCLAKINWERTQAPDSASKPSIHKVFHKIAFLGINFWMKGGHFSKQKIKNKDSYYSFTPNAEACQQLLE